MAHRSEMHPFNRQSINCSFILFFHIFSKRNLVENSYKNNEYKPPSLSINSEPLNVCGGVFLCCRPLPAFSY